MEKIKVEKTIEALVRESINNPMYTYVLWERLRPLCMKWASRLKDIDYSKEDLLQESYLILQKALKTYRPGEKTKFESYFKFMLYRWGRDYIHKKREVVCLDEDSDRRIEWIDESAQVEMEILEKEELRQLEVALQKLPQEEYTFLVELYMKEQSLKDLARHKSMSYKALTCKKYYILKKLKKFFEENNDPFRIYKV